MKQTFKPQIIILSLVIFILPLTVQARWISVDPKASKYPGISPYAYVRNNPLLRVDPNGMTDITFTVNRTTETKTSTIGSFSLTNSGDKKTVTGATLELPWNNNKVDKSRIPAGSYGAYLATAPGRKFSYPRIALTKVPGRTNIIVHAGNTPDNTQGCILVGKTAGKDRMNDSKTATTEISDYIQAIQVADEKKGEETTITVEVNNPLKEEAKKEEKQDGE